MATITLPAGSTSDDLQAAIDGAASGDIIELAGNMDFLDVVTVPAEISVTTRSVAGTVRVMRQTVNARHFEVLGTLTLEQIVVDGVYPGSGGTARGGLQVSGSLTLTAGAVVQNCYGNPYGGAIRVSGGELVLQAGSTIENNIAQSRGGGVYLEDASTMQMTGGTVTGNQVEFDSGTGGGVGVYSGCYFTMSDGLITANSLNLTGAQGGNGGGVAVNGGEFLMTGGTISYNNSKQYGAGIGVGANGTVTITDGLIAYNTPGSAVAGHNLSGGGVAVIGGVFNLNGGTIAYNEGVFGGGVHLGYASTTCRFNMSGGMIEENLATAYGGGVQAQSAMSLINIQGTGEPANVPLIRNNRADLFGGGILARAASGVVVDGGEIRNNRAANHGGGVYLESNASLNVSGASAIINNTAGGNGGGIFTGNLSYENPASLTAYQNITTAADTVFRGNQAVQAYYPPSNASDFTNLGYASTSTATAAGYIHPLNNYDINYVGPTPLVLYTVTYNANGGVGSYVEANIVAGERHVVLSTEEAGISRQGYDFAGWNTASDGGGDYYEPGDPITITGDVELYAQWTLIQGPYDVIYDANGGTGSYADTELPRGTVYTVLSAEQTQISRVNYTFAGWNTERGGGGTIYQPRGVITITENVILYAQWTAIPVRYRVIYQANGGTGGYLDRELTSGTLYPVLSAEQTSISRAGYLFSGWNTQADGRGMDYQPGDTIVITANVILYAQWLLAPEPPEPPEPPVPPVVSDCPPCCSPCGPPCCCGGGGDCCCDAGGYWGTSYGQPFWWNDYYC